MNKKIISIIALALFPLILLFFFSFYFYYDSAIKVGNSFQEYYTLVINDGDDLSKITKLLKKDNIIRSESIFKLYLKFSKLDVNIQAGEYDIPPHVNIKELVQILQNGVFDRKITFLEGERIEQYALRAAEAITKNEQDKENFINEFLNNPEAKEGYLFPDTYSYNTETTPGGLISWMRDRFDEIALPVINQSKLNLTPNEIVILASIIEREGFNSEDRPIIAGILINRLNEDIPLYVDATTQYQIDTDMLKTSSIEIVDFWKTGITQDYLESDSPFNTRKTFGLPPTPICNPGLESINAVVHSEKTSYLYYIHDKNGKVHYAKTLDEHNKNVAQYLGYN